MQHGGLCSLDAYVVAKEIAKRVHEGKIRHNELKDQATRAAKSCFLGYCAGTGDREHDGHDNEEQAFQHE
jgi:hypothetical protein